MAALDLPVEAYLAQLNSIQTHDTRSRLKAIKVPTMVLAGAEDILIPMNLSRELHGLIPGAEFATARGRARLHVGAPEAVQPGGPRLHREASQDEQVMRKRTF